MLYIKSTHARAVATRFSLIFSLTIVLFSLTVQVHTRSLLELPSSLFAWLYNHNTLSVSSVLLKTYPNFFLSVCSGDSFYHEIYYQQHRSYGRIGRTRTIRLHRNQSVYSVY